MNQNLATICIADFISESEIIEIESIMKSTHFRSAPDSNYGRSPMMADYHYIQLYDSADHQRIREIILPRLQKVLHPEIFVDDCHIMESVKPYTPHTDALTPVPRDGYAQAWTIIVPLDNYHSNTFVFEQECPWTKDVLEWVSAEGAEARHAISDDFYSRYFTHSRRSDFEYLTIHEVFPWRKGWMSATSRNRFHCSDNYLARGVKMKRAIVMWTSLPKNVLGFVSDEAMRT